MVFFLNAVSTNVTQFFREPDHFDFMESVSSLLHKRGKNRFRMWSCARSTGEEPYTIAMLLRENRELDNWKIEIVGTDISQRVLQVARRAVYGKASFRATDDFHMMKFFKEQDGGLRVNDDIRELVTISHLNLFDSGRMAVLGRMDLIFCRNVIIYFDQAAKRKVVESFYKSLLEGGYLLLGHSESLMNITTLFTLRHFKNDMIYQRPSLVDQVGEHL